MTVTDTKFQGLAETVTNAIINDKVTNFTDEMHLLVDYYLEDKEYIIDAFCTDKEVWDEIIKGVRNLRKNSFTVSILPSYVVEFIGSYKKLLYTQDDEIVKTFTDVFGFWMIMLIALVKYTLSTDLTEAQKLFRISCYIDFLVGRLALEDLIKHEHL